MVFWAALTLVLWAIWKPPPIVYGPPVPACATKTDGLVEHAYSGDGVSQQHLAEHNGDWVDVGAPNASDFMKLIFFIAPKDGAESWAQHRLLNISTPGHPQRFEFLSAAKLDALLANPNATSDVLEWLVRTPCFATALSRVLAYKRPPD